ncbi:MAG: large subunit ribosomal protein L15 [Candidatus Latescibacterota bacterium]|jgi:large subunit ribosomal protein L15
MRLGDIKCPRGSRRDRKRLGQGIGSGTGKTAGKGHKGQRARSGASRGNRRGFIGGTLAYFRHMPKVGFSNHDFKVVYQTVNLADIEARGLEGEVGLEQLIAAGLVRKANQPVKILGDGELSRGLTIKAQHFSQSARAKIEKAGGQAELI